MKLAIIGGRDFTDYKKAELSFGRYFLQASDSEYSDTLVDEIISGSAPGADTIARKLAEKYSIKYTDCPALWDDLEALPCKIKYKGDKPYNALAGFNRNKDIISQCDIVLAFWNGISPGTQNSLGLAKKMKKDTIIIYDPQSILVGVIKSYYSLLDVRAQIKNAKVGGYHLVWEHGGLLERIEINNNGVLSHWPIGFYDELDKMLAVLIDWNDV